MSGHESSAKAIFYAFLANFGIAVAKGAAAFYTGSGAMLAEAIHSLADCTNQVLLFVGLRASEKPATKEHPLGQGKAIYVWSFVVAILLFSMGGLFSVYEGVHKLQEAKHAVEGAEGGLKNPWIAVAVLLVSIVLESFSLWGAMREINQMRGEKSIMEWLRTSRSAELVVVFGEDVAALAGLVIAFVFLLLAILTGNESFDAFGSIAIGLLLLVISVFLFQRVKALLIGRSADPDMEKLIQDHINNDDAIEKVFRTLTVQFGSKVMLAVKIKMKSGLSIDEAVEVINKLEASIKSQFPEVQWCFVEPDVKD